MTARIKIVTIVVLVLLYDRVEFLYYGVDPGRKICLILDQARCFRADSFIYYASIRVQYIIFSMILWMLLPAYKKPLTALMIASVLYFFEYFLTYNEPLYKLPVGVWELPISIAAVKLGAWIYFSYEVVRKIMSEYGS